MPENPRIQQLLDAADALERGHVEKLGTTGNHEIDLEATNIQRMRAASLRCEALIWKLREQDE
jgi:hypothetical protein